MNFYGVNSSFFSTGSNSSSNWMSNLTSLTADYNSIRSGSYRKLVKAYYSKNSEKNDSTKKDESVTKKQNAADTKLSQTKADGEDLAASAKALTATGTKSLFKQKEITTTGEDGKEVTKLDYDRNALYKAASAFVEDYNSMVSSGSKGNSTNILSKTLQMTKTTNANKNLLSDVGITIKDGNKLSIDEETFKNADINKVKSLFQGNSSYAGRVAQKATEISAAAQTEASKGSGLYNNSGSYYGNYNSLFDSMF